MARELLSSEVLDALSQKLGAVGLVTDMGNRDLRAFGGEPQVSSSSALVRSSHTDML